MFWNHDHLGFLWFVLGLVVLGLGYAFIYHELVHALSSPLKVR